MAKRASSKCPGCGEKFVSNPDETSVMKPKADGGEQTRVCRLCAKKIEKYNVGSVDGLKRLEKIQRPS